MFKNALIAGCTIAMFSLGGLGTIENADAGWRGVPRSVVRNFERQQRNFERDFNRNFNRAQRDFHRDFRGRPYGNFHRGPVIHNGFYGYQRGFINTPYFSIGF